MVLTRHLPTRPHISAGTASSSSRRREDTPQGFKARLLVLSIGYALSGLAGVAIHAPATAQAAGIADPQTDRTPARDYAISAGVLSDVLAEFAAMSGAQIVFDTQMLGGRRSNGLRGRYRTDDGFAQLLAGSGYEAVSIGNARYTLRKSSAAAITALSPVTVSANAVPLAGEAPAAYAGGQVARGGRLGILGSREIMDTPFNQSNYTAELVQNQQARYVSDTLDNDPSAQSTNPTAGHDGISIRGFHLGNGQALFNGMQNIVSGTLSSITAEGFERIEVLKGPAALLNGNVGRAGGALNLIPKRAGDEPLTQFTAEYSTGSQLGGHADIGRRFGDAKEFGLRFNGVYRDGDTGVDHQSRKTTLATLGLDYRGDRARVEADLGHQQIDVQGMRRITRMTDGVAIPAAPDNRKNWFDPAEFSEADLLYGTVRGELDLNDSVTAFAAAGGSELEYTRLAANRIITNVRGDFAAGMLAETTATQVHSSSFEGGVRGKFLTGPVHHQLVLAYSTADRNEKRSVPSGIASTRFPASNINNPVFGARPNATAPGFGNVKRSLEETNSSIALVDTLSMFDEHAQLTVGARLQQVKADNFNTTTGATTSRYNEDALTPMLGLVVKPWQGVSLYGNYIEGLTRGPVAPTTAANAGQAFAPYATEQYEIGAKQDFGSFTTTVALYQIAQPSTVTSAANIFGIDGEQRHRGVDANVFGELAPGIRLLGGVAYIDSTLSNTAGGIHDGNQGIGTPAWRAVLGAEWDTPFVPGLTLTGRLIRNGAAYLDAANTQKVPHWTRVDIGARYQLTKAITIRAALENAFDKSYWTTSGESELILNAPRTLKLSGSFEF